MSFLLPFHPYIHYPKLISLGTMKTLGIERQLNGATNRKARDCFCYYCYFSEHPGKKLWHQPTGEDLELLYQSCEHKVRGDQNQVER